MEKSQSEAHVAIHIIVPVSFTSPCLLLDCNDRIIPRSNIYVARCEIHVEGNQPYGPDLSLPAGSFTINTHHHLYSFHSSRILKPPAMTLSKGKGGRKSTETEAQRERDMWIARRASESSLLNEDRGPLPTTGDVDALIEWNALATKRHGRSARLANDPPVSQELTRQQIRAWK